MRKLLKGVSLSIITGALIVGALLVIGFHSALNATNTESFCISCHEMGIAYEEYKDTVHYKNRTGVRATCSDCHVPQEFGTTLLAPLTARKNMKIIG